MKRSHSFKSAILLTTSFIVVVCFAVLLVAPAAIGGDLTKSGTLNSSRTKHYVVERKILPEAPPEAGVKLLIGILKRIGNTPQIAMQQAQQNRIRAELNQSNKLFNQNVTDPALAIRPRESNFRAKKRVRKTMERYEGASKVAGKKLAYYRPGPSGSDAASSYSPVARGRGNIRTYGSLSKDSELRLKKSAEKLYNLSNALSNLQRRDTNSFVQSQQKRNRQIISANNKSQLAPSKGLLIANSPKIVDYTKHKQTRFDKAKAGIGGARGIAADEDFAEEQKQLDQPAYFKHLKEYTKNEASMSQPLPARERELDDSIKQDSAYRSTFGRRASPVHLAYMPPNLFSGVPGLRLGASKSSVQRFMNKHGSIEKTKFGTWDVWVLKNKKTGRTSLQVYMRNGIVEAFRIFDSQFVPSRIKVSLETTLESMKEKFGEPAFILNEPRIDKHTWGRGIKNYVYPISQVSFQLARGNSKDKSIKIRSMFLFKFL